MDTQSPPVKDQPPSLPETKPTLSDSTSKPPKESEPSPDSRSQDSSPPITNLITIPSCSRWFSWEKVHESEKRFLPEFFDEKKSSLKKSEEVYIYYRNSMIKMFRENPSKKITFTQARKVLVGDVGSIRRVFDFLESWGLINYSGVTTKNQSKSADGKENNRLSGEFKGNLYDGLLSKKESSMRFCNDCKIVCSIACFHSDKLDLTLCARCYVRANQRGSLPSTDFRRVEISEQTKTEWTDKETLQLLEAIMHYGEDWKKVAEHVGGRSEKECVARFVKLPFKEQFLNLPDSEDDKYNLTESGFDAGTEEDDSFPSSPSKKRRLTPFADTSNPIMAQVAFLSAMVGSRVAEAAAQAAVRALSGSNLTTDRRHMERSCTSLPDDKNYNVTGSDGNGNESMDTLVEAVAEAQAHIQKEEQELEKSISDIVNVQMKEYDEKLVRFEEFELQMEREWKQLQYMKNLLFTDQLTLLFQKTTSQGMGGSIAGAKPSDPGA